LWELFVPNTIDLHPIVLASALDYEHVSLRKSGGRGEEILKVSNK
jgi:hypothetical protein